MTSNPVSRSYLRFSIFLGLGLGLIGSVARSADNTTPLPLVHILATDPAASESGPDTATFTVFRTGPTNEPLTVSYRVTGSAVNGVDYEELPGQVTIPAAASSAPITITPIDDALVEGNESVVVFVHQPVVWPPPYIVCWPSFARAEIEDNETGLTNQPPRVRLSNPPDGSVFLAPVDIHLVAQATDPDGHVRVVEFFDDTNSLGIVSDQPIIVRPVPLADDALELEGEREPLLYPDFVDDVLDVAALRPASFSLRWTNVPAGPHALTAVAIDNLGAQTRSEVVHIRVVEPPLQPIVNVRATDPVAAEPDPATDRLDTATFTVHRSGSTEVPLTVFYRLGGTAENGVDYTELPHSVVIPRGSSTADVVIDPIDDQLVEGPESVVLRLVPPVCIDMFPPPPDCYQVGPYDTARAVIHDNDVSGNQPPVVALIRPLDGSIFLAPADLTLIAAARDFDGHVVTVEFFAGTNSLGVVTNRPQLLNSNTPPFALKWPNVPPGSYLLTAEATDNDGAVGVSKPIEIKVVDRGLPPIVSIEATDADAAEGSLNTVPNTATFTVKRTGPTDRALLVFYSIGGTAENGVDYQKLSGRVNIPSGASSTPIVVEPIDDHLVEGLETVSIRIEPSYCIELAVRPIDCYVVGTNDRARIVIHDNDTPGTNSPPKVALAHPSDGDVFVAPADIRICAEARDAEGFVRTVEFFANDQSLGVVSNSLAAGGVAVNDPIRLEQLFCLQWPDVSAGGYVLTAKATDNRGLSSFSDPIEIKVIEVHGPTVVTITAEDPFASEGGSLLDPLAVDDGAAAAAEVVGPPMVVRPNVAVFVVKRDRGTNIDLTVRYRLEGTASNGEDYRKLDGTVVIPAGSWQAPIVIVPLEDDLVEGTETVIAVLDPTACPPIVPAPPDCYLVGDPARAVAYIRDDDQKNQPPRVAIGKPDNDSVFQAPADIKIEAVVNDPDGYVTEVEFFEGTNSIGKDIRVFIVAPPPGETQRFSMIWSNVPAGRYHLTAKATDDRGASNRSAPVAIQVVPPCPIPVVTLEAVDRRATEHDPRLEIPTDPASFRVTRSCNTNLDLTVHYEVGGTAKNGEDYAKLDGTVVIPAGSDSADIFIDPIDDDLVEGIETVELKLLEVACIAVVPTPPDCYAVGTPDHDTVYIHDNEDTPPRVAIVRPETGERFKQGAPIPIVAQALDPDGWVGRVEFFDGTNSIGVEEIVFLVAPPPGQLQRFSMIWSNAALGRHVLTAKATDDQGLSTVSGPVGIEVVDTSPPTLVSICAVDPIAREGAPTNAAVFRVRRTGDTNAPLTVQYSVHGTAENGVDYPELPGTITIAAGRRAARIVVVPIDDHRPEPIETIILRIEAATLYQVGRWARAAAIIVDNDRLRIDTVCLDDHNFHLGLEKPQAACYRIEVGDDLIKWEMTEPCPVVEGAVHFVDPEASEHEHRFYRLRPCLDVEVFDDEE